jgi:hypothetical protein
VEVFSFSRSQEPIGQSGKHACKQELRKTIKSEPNYLDLLLLRPHTGDYAQNGYMRFRRWHERDN